MKITMNLVVYARKALQASKNGHPEHRLFAEFVSK